jgi:hypothetical protein
VAWAGDAALKRVHGTDLDTEYGSLVKSSALLAQRRYARSGQRYARLRCLKQRFWLGQRIEGALAVEIDDGVMDGLIERGDICEGLDGEVMGLKVAADRFDFIEFGSNLGRHSSAGGQGSERALMVWIGSCPGPVRPAWPGPSCGPKRRSSCSDVL